MKTWILDRVLWTIALVSIAVACAQVVAGSRSHRMALTKMPVLPEVLMYDSKQLEEAADSVAANDPFRLDRNAPAPTMIDQATANAPAPSESLNLVLTGVSGGPPWHAIVAGLPGRDGEVFVSAGDTIGEVRIKSIRRDTLVVQAGERTLTLTLRR